MTTYTWKNSSSGIWSTASNWTPSGPPAAGSDVDIDAGSGSTITYNTTEWAARGDAIQGIGANQKFSDETWTTAIGSRSQPKPPMAR